MCVCFGKSNKITPVFKILFPAMGICFTVFSVLLAETVKVGLKFYCNASHN